MGRPSNDELVGRDIAARRGGSKSIPERPLPCAPDMVREILAGRKLQTRRLIVPAPPKDIVFDPTHAAVFQRGGGYERWCPYGNEGYRLWVREAWRTAESLDKHSGAQIAELALVAGWNKPWAPIQYEADGALSSRDDWVQFGPFPSTAKAGRYRHARFMPRWAARILLEIEEVRAEPLGEISEEDARREGVRPHDGHGVGHDGWRVGDGEVFPTARMAFAAYWNKLNEARGFGWAKRPWVWVITFRLIERARS